VSRARHAIRWTFHPFTERPAWWPIVLGLALVAAVLLAVTQGALHLDATTVVRALADAEDPMHGLLCNVRLPRIVVAILVGACLAVAGALMQTVVRNPLADPSLIGVSAGAGVAGLIVIVAMPAASYALPLAAFSGAASASGVILALSWRGAAADGPLRIILSGVAVQAILFALIGLTTFLYADRAPSFAAFTVGSLAGTGWRDVAIAVPGTILGLVLSMAAVRPLDLLLLDDETACGVGLPVRWARFVVSCLSSLLAATAVSVAGLVGFVGLVVPNAIRLLVGPGHARLLPLCALGGAIRVVLADVVARTCCSPLELPVGSLLALIGGPYFLILLWRRLP